MKALHMIVFSTLIIACDGRQKAYEDNYGPDSPEREEATEESFRPYRGGAVGLPSEYDEPDEAE